MVVATPVHLHYDLAKKSLEAGKHTFVEKPMTQTSEQGNELVMIAARKKLTLMVGHTFIYSAPVRRIKEIVEAGDIGEIQYISLPAPEPRPLPEGHQRRVGPGPARHLDHPLPAGEGPPSP